MKTLSFLKGYLILISLIALALLSCDSKTDITQQRIVFLHHSTGSNVWYGNATIFTKSLMRIAPRFASVISHKAYLPLLVEKYNRIYGTTLQITQMIFPKASTYGWNNYPYDYYNIFVKNGASERYLDEPTLEVLTDEYNIIMLKHCFPVCNIQAEADSINVNSDVKTLKNYKLQYEALKEKFLQFPNTKFIVWTGAAQVRSTLTKEEAERCKEFFSWVTEEWDNDGDNIYIWDFYQIETEGELYLKDEFATSATDSHPNKVFSAKAVSLLFNRILDIAFYNGEGTNIKGESI